jgi:hypothetical protein
MRLPGKAARMTDRIVVYRVFVGNCREKRSLRTLKCRWEDNIKIDFQAIEWRRGINLSGPE